MIVATGEATAKATHNTGATAKKLTAESTPGIYIYRPANTLIVNILLVETDNYYNVSNSICLCGALNCGPTDVTKNKRLSKLPFLTILL